MYCEKCGKQVNEKDRFCPKCGNKISSPIGIIQNNSLPSNRYKKGYLLTHIVCSLWLLGFLFALLMITADRTGGYGYEKVVRKVFAEYWGMSLAATAYCAYIAYKRKLHLMSWKVKQMAIGTAITIGVCLLAIIDTAINTPVMSNIEAYEWMKSRATFTVILLIAVVIVAVLYVIALKKKSVDLLNQKECEIITAMIGAIVSVMLLSFLVYAFILR